MKTDLPMPMNVVDFIRSPYFLNDQSLSDTQITCLKSIFGLPLTDGELEIYCRGTGRDKYDGTEQREVTLLAGRRSGKTGKIAAPIVCFQACRNHGIPEGEYGYVTLMAPTLSQAHLAFQYVRAYFCRSPILRNTIEKDRKNELTLKNRIIVGAYASTHARVRGRTIVAAVFDEFAHWPQTSEAPGSVEEVLAAVRPATINVPTSKVVKISTPFGKSGLPWDEFQRRGELDFCVWQLSTADMNPAVATEMLEAERHRNEEVFDREYMALFSDSTNCWIVPELLDACVTTNRRNLPAQPGVTYSAALDPGVRGNAFALVIVHETSDGTVVVDCVASWRGSKKVPLPLDCVLLEVKHILQTYAITSVVGDQFCWDFICQHLIKFEISYELRVFSGQTRPKLFSSLACLVTQRKIELPDDADLLGQLRNLREEKTLQGGIDIRPSSGAHDDKAVALALAVHELLHRATLVTLLAPMLMDSQPSAASLGLIPGNCQVESICENFPRCTDEEYCLGFKDERLTCIRN